MANIVHWKENFLAATFGNHETKRKKKKSAIQSTKMRVFYFPRIDILG